MKHSSLLVCTLLFSLAQAAVALPITYNFAGDVVQVIDSENHLGGLGIGQSSTFSGSFTYDTAELPKLSKSTYANYKAGDIKVSIDDTFFYEAITVGDFPNIQIYNNDPYFYDGFNYAAVDGPGSSGQNTITRFDTKLGLDWLSLQMILTDHSKTANSDLALPGSLDLSDFSVSSFTITARSTTGDSPGYSIRGQLTSLVVEVPEPASVPLLAAGIMILISLRKFTRTG